ncbi:MAG: alpha/beta fold hydrolase [Bacilli bacterium]|nr:alpha/beta fold hydrolase [Bacilli bacterium]
MCFRKKAILMIHGFVGGCYDFGSFHNELQLYKKFDVYTYTLPAHEKFIVNDVKYTEWIKESIKQIEFLINNGYKEIYLIGHSMGGVIAAYLASHYKEVKKLVLAAPAFRYFYFKDGKVDIKSLNTTLKNISEILKGADTEQVVSRILKTPISTMIEFTKLVNHCQNCVNYITCPTLTIRGMDDIVVPNEGVEFVHNGIKSKSNTLVNIKKLNHECFTHKKNNEVKNIIKEFLVKRPKNKKEIIEL